MNEETAVVFDIEKFAVHDGPGIRTVVFIKGCPLRCVWCHNPESQSFEPELVFKSEKCMLCGRCAAVCPQKCHVFENSRHELRRDKCVRCGRCAEECPAEALKLAGRKLSVAEVMSEVLRDRAFYENSGGGLTLSGGEPLCRPAFTISLLETAKRNGLHTAVETCGFAPWETVAPLLPLVDLWLWDIKAAPHHHRELTDVDCAPILDNLRHLDAAGAATILRCPLVPGVNDTEADLAHIADVANSLKHVRRIDVEPYHPLGENKCVQLGREPGYRGEFASPEAVEKALAALGKLTSVPAAK